MIQQNLLPIKLERMEVKHTARSGLFLYAEFMEVFGVDDWIMQYMPKPCSGRGYDSLSFIKPLSMMMYGGGGCIEDMKEIREDKALRKACGIKTVPSPSAEGDWLKRVAEREGIEGMELVNNAVIQKIFLKDKRKTYTLIVDPFIIETGKRDCRMTYLGVKWYRPVIAVIKELDLIIAYEFKEGNDNGGRLEIIKKAFEIMPEGKIIGKVLLDSEYYSNEVMEYLNEKGVKWAIAVDKDDAVKKAIESMAEAEWKVFKTREGNETNREVAKTVHTTNKGKTAFNLVSLRWKEKQGELFDNAYKYHCIGTNMDGEEGERVVWQYNERANIENIIRELKGGFGMDGMPSGDCGANALYFGIGILTCNLFIAQKYFTMPYEWANKTIKSIRWLLLETVGRVIERSRQMTLKIAATVEKYRIYLTMRRRLCEFATG